MTQRKPDGPVALAGVGYELISRRDESLSELADIESLERDRKFPEGHVHRQPAGKTCLARRLPCDRTIPVPGYLAKSPVTQVDIVRVEKLDDLGVRGTKGETGQTGPMRTHHHVSRLKGSHLFVETQ